MGLTEQKVGIWRLSLEQIEATVAEHLGRGRVPGNQPGPCFSRQVAMYLAKNVAGWSTTRIGRFYNGRHHTTVLHAISKVERLRRTDEALDTVLNVLTLSLTLESNAARPPNDRPWRSELIDAIALRVIERLQQSHIDTEPLEGESGTASARIGNVHSLLRIDFGNLRNWERG